MTIVNDSRRALVVAVASKHGSMSEIAERIGQRLLRDPNWNDIDSWASRIARQLAVPARLTSPSTFTKVVHP